MTNTKACRKCGTAIDWSDYSYCITCQLAGKVRINKTDLHMPVQPRRTAPTRVRLVCVACSREARQPGRCPTCNGRVFAEPVLLGRLD